MNNIGEEKGAADNGSVIEYEAVIAVTKAQALFMQDNKVSSQTLLKKQGELSNDFYDKLH